MKAVGLFLLFAGFAIVMSAFVLLSVSSPRAMFVLAGIGVQLLGLVLTFRSHLSLEDQR